MKYNDIIQKLTIGEKARLLTGGATFESLGIPEKGIPALSLSDGPSGVRKQMGAADHLGLNESLKATCFPSAAAIANSWDPELSERVGAALGAEASALKVDVLLGPGLNIQRSPMCGRNFEYYSEDPILSGRMAAGMVRGIQSTGTAACVKHFAVNSQETLRMVNDSVVDERTLREIYLTGFEIAVREGHPMALMTSYNRINGEYANENEHLLKDILRGEWGFDGMVVTDWGGSNNHVAGVRCTSTLEMPGPVADSADQLIEAVREGRLEEAELDARVEELLKVALRPHEISDGYDISAHHEIAREAAEQCLVLLKNEGNLLPLQRGQRIAVIGDFAFQPRYQGAGSSLVNATKIDVPIDCLKQAGLSIVGEARGFDRRGRKNKALMDEALAATQDADVILFFAGLSEDTETEGRDRKHMRLAENQIELLSALAGTGKPVAVVLAAGSPVETDWAQDCSALLFASLGGQAAGQAIANALTGKVNPSGKLAQTWPKRGEDAPTAGIWPGERVSVYREGLFVGYRYYETIGRETAYPFGFGLSYTRFEYSDLEVSPEGVKFTLANVGNADGAEIAQMYISRAQTQLARPKLELKGFARVFLKAGERKRVEIPFDQYAFRFYDAEKNAWRIEGGAYHVLVGANCRDILLEGEVQVPGAEILYTQAKSLPVYYSGRVKNVDDDEYAQLLGRAIPEDEWLEVVDRNTPMCRLTKAKSRLARLVGHVLGFLMRRSEKRGEVNLNLMFIYSVPLRGLAKQTGGAVNEAMVDGLVQMANGRFCRGVKMVWRGWRSMKGKK